MAINDEIPKSRITLTYRTAVNGEPEDVQLPLRLLMMGDFSNGTSKDRQLDLDRRELRNLDGTNLDAVMGDMNMSIRLDVANRINPAASEEIPVELPITSMRSFEPAEVAKHIPKVKALLLLRKLLLEVQGNLDNRKEFRKMLRALAQDEQAVAKLMEELPGFDDFRVPRPAQLESGAAPEAAAPASAPTEPPPAPEGGGDDTPES